jgi:CDP-diacylglycerol pyrophosphatase
MVNAKLRRILFTLVAVAVTSAPGGKGGLHTPGQKSVELPPNAGRDAFRQIVQDQCVINWKQHKNPDPCERVVLADQKFGDSGYAVLADPSGGAHYLLIPTRTMRGVEGAELLDPDAPNYFAEAWHARDLISQFVGHDVARTAIGLVVNTVRTRTQDQFHIHISCLRQDVVDSLRAAREKVSETWSPVSIAGSDYQALLIGEPELDGSNLFELLAKLNPSARHHMGDYTLIVAGMQLRTGPGFIALTGTGPTGEMLLDSTCTVAGGGG